MSYSYNTEQLYPQNNIQNNPYIYQYYNQPSAAEKTIKSACLGFAGGAAVSAGADLIRNRKPVNNGEVNNSFAKQVLDKIIKKGYTFKNKDFFNQKISLLNKLKKVKSPEEFAKLMKKYKTYASTLCDSISLDSLCKTVNRDNLKGKVSSLKKRIEANLESELRNVKDIINLCWDSENKKFVKPKSVNDNIFKVIKNTKNNIEWKKMLKYGGIGAGILGALTLGYSVFMKNNNPNQM